MISIIVPVYNVEKYLKKCVDSILAQNFCDIEVLLVDDGSTDLCPELCDDYVRQDERVRVIHKKNGGLSDARNAGIDAAKGDLLAFVDGDDYIAPQMFDVLYENIIQTDADISVCDFIRVKENDIVLINDTNNIRTSDYPYFLNDLFESSVKVVLTVAWNKLYKKAVFDGVRYPVGRYHEDEAVIHRLLVNCSKIVYTDSALYYYVQHQGSIMSLAIEKRVPDYFFSISDRISFLEEKGFHEEAKKAYDNLLFYLLSEMYVEHYNKPEGHKERFTFYRRYLQTAFNDFGCLYSKKDRMSVYSRMLLKHEKFFWIYRWCRINIKERIETAFRRKNGQIQI